MQDIQFLTDFDYVRWLTYGKNPHIQEVEQRITEKNPTYRLFGRSLSALHQIAVCYPSCIGGPHVYEALVGRICNHAGSAFHLTLLGFYDEALNLVRGMGEICNLLLLFLHSSDDYKKWLSSDFHERWKHYRPAVVREKLRQLNAPVPMDDDVYSILCEMATHVTPETRPNMHTSGLNAAGFIGGTYQESGFEKAFDQLVETTGMAAMIITRGFERDELFRSILEALNEIKGT